MKAYRQAVGQHGEDLACQLLAGQGYEIIARNWRCPRGEIDIVARERDCWVFVEVKTRRGHRVVSPEDALTSGKLARLVELGGWYLGEIGQSDVDWRIDLVAIELSDGSAPLRTHHIRGVGAY